MDDGERIVKPGFHAAVYAVVRSIPPGRLMSYGDVARALGSPRVARQVGWALAAVRDEDVPWHRVLSSRGIISFPAGTDPFHAQRDRLIAEGVAVAENGRVDLARLRHHPPDAGADPE